MKRFEYRREYIDNPPESESESAVQYLNELGKLGWQVVSIAGGYEDGKKVLI